MNMNKNVLEHMDKAAYIILLCICSKIFWRFGKMTYLCTRFE